jgi:hypothetical protein
MLRHINIKESVHERADFGAMRQKSTKKFEKKLFARSEMP